MPRETTNPVTERGRPARGSPIDAAQSTDRPTPERGQTTIDFALGVSVFLLSVAFAFAMLPSVFVPFNAPVDDDLTTRADRTAATLLADLSTGGNALDPDRTADRFDATNRTQSALRSSLGLPATTRVNVTVTDAETGAVASAGGRRLRAGAAVGDHPTAAASRIVAIAGDPYRLQVYLW
ncbi:DUF7287 family protein [Halorussus halobius]|uniref:DUF7287 family protein n=1 Tax=Halorussus halobius TaxID=1710537 RepID=UPI001FCE5898|nr:hypothetical protein [Halorussus halobius]